MRSSHPHLYVIGDGTSGVASVVEGIRDGRLAAEAILGHVVTADGSVAVPEAELYSRRGCLGGAVPAQSDSGRCLHCDSICENCVEVCPNRANVSITVPGMKRHQVLHVDYMCNECGNCRSFCPWDSAPYQDKFTLFANEADMEDSRNQGFTVLDRAAGRCLVRLQGRTFAYTVGTGGALPDELDRLIETIIRDYAYLLL